jgi:hypothetical protein
MDPLLDLFLQAILNTDHGSAVDVTDPSGPDTFSDAVIELDFSFSGR